MVTHINIAVDDDVADRGRDVKDAKEWTWEEFFEHAVEEFDTNGDD